MSARQIYNFENVFEPPVCALFIAAGMVAWCSQGQVTLNPDGSTAINAPQQPPQPFQSAPIPGTAEGPAFQKDRPRAEVIFTKGQGLKQWFIQPSPPNTNEGDRESAWRGRMSIELVTDPNPTEHLAFVADCRNILATLPTALNGIWLPYHKMQWPVQDAGETHGYDPESKVFSTKFSLQFDFSIQTNAWALLTTP